MLYPIAKYLLKSIAIIYNRLKIYNKSRIPKSKSLIIVANHVSFLDPIYVGLVVPRRLNFMAKKESFNNKFFGWLLHSLGAFPVNRDKPDIKAIKTSLKILKEDKVLVLFPEGTRVKKELEEMKEGAAYFAYKTNATILPIYIKGTDKVMPKGKLFIKPARVELFVGQPLETETLKKDSQKQSIEIISELVKVSLQEISAEANKK